jgi:hypothetical protein
MHPIFLSSGIIWLLLFFIMWLLYNCYRVRNLLEIWLQKKFSAMYLQSTQSRKFLQKSNLNEIIQPYIHLHPGGSLIGYIFDGSNPWHCFSWILIIQTSSTSFCGHRVRFGFGLWYLMPLSTISWRRQEYKCTRRKPLTCRKSQTLSHNVVSSTPRYERGSNSRL